MQKDRIASSPSHRGIVDDVAGESAGALRSFRFLSHARPHIGRHHRGAFRGRLGTLDDAVAWAHELSRLAPLTIAGHKVGLEHAQVEPGEDEAFETARRAAWASADAEEGRTAFLDKRRPDFTGR